MAPSLSTKRDVIPELFKLVQIEKVNWNKVQQRASTQPQEAHFVHPDSKFTGLHHAVLAQDSNKSNNGRLHAIRALLLANPLAATSKCAQYGYTPLAYTCMIHEDDHEVVKLLLEFAQDSINILSNDGKSPMELHMKKMSQRMAADHTSTSNTATLTALISQTNNNNYNVSKALETLFSYNTLRILEKLALEEAIASLARLQARRQARLAGNKKDVKTTPAPITDDSSPSKGGFDNFWVWQWVLVFLEHEHVNRFIKEKSVPQFYPLLVASSIKDCPLPILIMAVRANPSQISQADSVTGNLPLHNVAFWDAQEPDKISRKSMALTVLGREYPLATKIKNKQGKTPLSLALETGTSWDNGVRCLTQKKEVAASPVPPKREKRPLKKERSGRSLRT
jgi:hypothetical protein